MKIFYFFIACCLIVSNSSGSLPEEPPEVRSIRLSNLLNQYAKLNEGEVMQVGILTSHLVVYSLKWKMPPSQSSQTEIDSTAAVTHAIAQGQSILPRGLAPEKGRLLGVEKHLLSEGSSLAWIWVIAFDVDDKPLLAGLAIKKPLLFPVGPSGQLILEVEKKTWGEAFGRKSNGQPQKNRGHIP